MNINNNSEITIKEKKQLVCNINKLNKIEHVEIFKIFKKDNIKYTENNNGIFININKVPDVTLYKIIKFINFCNSNNVKLNEYTIKRKNIENNYFLENNDFN